jgi:hypothetical protein
MSNTDQNNDTTDNTEPLPAETEARARELGWVPEGEWKGAPPKNGFLDPAEFVRRGEKIMPIVRAEARKWEAEAAKLRSELEATRSEHRDTIKRIERMSNAALENQRTQIEARYAERKEAAVEVGDKAAYNQAVKDEKEAVGKLDERLADKDEAKVKAVEQAMQLPKEVADTIAAWNADNGWYGQDSEMTAVAQNHHAKLLKDKPGLKLRENLDAVSEYVKKRYPEKFEASDDDDEDRPRRGSSVESGNRLNGGGRTQTLFSKLPAEAKAQCDRFIKDEGFFLDKGETAEKHLGAARERYAKQYLGDDK